MKNGINNQEIQSMSARKMFGTEKAYQTYLRQNHFMTPEQNPRHPDRFDYSKKHGLFQTARQRALYVVLVEKIAAAKNVILQSLDADSPFQDYLGTNSLDLELVNTITNELKNSFFFDNKTGKVSLEDIKAFRHALKSMEATNGFSMMYYMTKENPALAQIAYKHGDALVKLQESFDNYLKAKKENQPKIVNKHIERVKQVRTSASSKRSKQPCGMMTYGYNQSCQNLRALSQTNSNTLAASSSRPIRVKK